MLAYMLGKTDILTADLNWLLQQDLISKKTKRKIVKFAFSLWPEPDNLLTHMGKKNNVQLFQHAVRTKNLDAAAYLWSSIEQTKGKTDKILDYVNLLINNYEIESAAHIWKQFYPSPSFLYNGNFSSPIVGSGFGWRNWETPGVTKDFQSSKSNTSMLHIHFTGTKNIHFFHINQIIQLPPDRSFELSGQFQSKDLSTDQRPYMEVIGWDCPMEAQSSKMVEQNQPWTPFSLTFTMPELCKAIQLRIRRLPSNNIDNLIKGDLWLTNFSLKEVRLSTVKIRISALKIVSGSSDLRLPAKNQNFGRNNSNTQELIDNPNPVM
jgi:hypothetical protein